MSGYQPGQRIPLPDDRDAAAPRPGRGGQLACPLCGGTDFQEEESRQDSRWGFTSHVFRLLICRQCKYVLHFYETHSFFDVN